MTDPTKSSKWQSVSGFFRWLWECIYRRPAKVMHPVGYWAAVVGFMGFLYLLYALFWPSPPREKYRVLVPLAATSGEYLAFVQKDADESGNATYDSRYNNRASQNIREIVNAAKVQWFSDQHATQGQLVFQDDKDIDFFFFPEGSQSSPDEPDTFRAAFEQAMRTAEKAKRKVVAVLGNVSSSSTLKYGKFCGEKGLPMILPLATATDITHRLKLLKVPAVLRLPPTNDKQARAISDFFLEREIRRTVVVKDISNDAYSRDLVEGFREHFVEGRLSSSRGHGAEFGQILSVVPVAGNETAPFVYSSLSSGENSALLIVGMTNSSIETIAQANASGAHYEFIVLTDGAVDKYLAPQIAAIQGMERVSNLYLSFPLPCVMPKALTGYLARDTNLNREDFEMSHALYVADGTYLILSMLASGLKTDPAKLGSEVITEAINKLKNDAEEKERQKLSANPQAKNEEPIGVLVGYTLPFQDAVKREYQIDKFGNNVNARYYLYSISVPAKGNSIIKRVGATAGGDSLVCFENAN